MVYLSTSICRNFNREQSRALIGHTRWPDAGGIIATGENILAMLALGAGKLRPRDPRLLKIPRRMCRLSFVTTSACTAGNFQPNRKK